MTKPYLSIVIPAYNEVLNLRVGVLDPSFEFLKKQKYSWEVIFVDDGSTDQTYKLLKNFCAKTKHCHLLQIPHGGRAAAMTKGMLTANGKYVLYADFDQSTALSQVEPFLNEIRAGADLVIGMRGERHTVRKDGVLNKLRAKIFVAIVRAILLPKIVDINCGFKLYKNSAAKIIFSSLKVSVPLKISGGYMGAIDTEILYLAQKNKFKIHQIPVDWIRRPPSSLRLVSETARILHDLALMKYYSLTGKYESTS